MEYKGRYHITGNDDNPAVVTIEKGRLRINIKDATNQDRLIFWPFEIIVREQFWKEGRSVVRTEGYPEQVIEINSREFNNKLEETLYKRSNTWGKRVWYRSSAGLLKVLIVFLAVLVAGYLWLVPFLADRMARRVPISYEESLGNSLFNAMKGSFTIDQKKTLYINDFFGELKIQTPYNIRITVVKENVSNAFAMPGGNIVVYDKLISQMRNYEDLAALLSHEFTHVNNKHTTRSLFRKLGSSIFLSVVLGDVGAVSSIILRNADNLKGLNYSRSLEKEADFNGLKILSERKIDCNGFVRLFGILQKESNASTTSQPEWTNSHPNLDKRIRYIQNNKHFNEKGVAENETLKTLFMKMQTTW